MKSRAAAYSAIDGVLLIDKPAGITSHAAVQCVKRLLQAAKAGHVGTLDPLATGLLPVCLGEATKFSVTAANAEKGYDAEILLGVTTTTGDLEGDVTERRAVKVSLEEVHTVLQSFTGTLAQTPPMYSALKYEGKPLYAHARAGRSVAVQPRPITIHEIGLRDFSDDRLRIRVRCSKGTYVRVLAEDIGRALGCGGTLAGLRRTAVGAIGLDQAVELARLEAMPLQQRKACLRAIDCLVASLPEVVLETHAARRMLNGQSGRVESAGVAGLIRLYDPSRRFLGIGELQPDGCIAPKRLIAASVSETSANP